MAREAGGRHCASCDKTVVDVRRATAAELTAKAMLYGHDGRFCGHARVDADGVVQLRTPKASASKRTARSLAVATALALPLGCTETDHTFVTVAESPTPSGPAPADAPPLVPAAASAPSVATECPRPETVDVDGPRAVVVVKGEMTVPRFIHFPSLSVALGPDDQSIVDETARLLTDDPGIVRLKIVGHADGTENAPVELGMKRATVIANLLVSKGIAASRVEATSAGSSQPIEPNDTPEGRAANRRITFEPIR